MLRKDARALKYWASGRLNKPTTNALQLMEDCAFYAGRLVAVRRKSTTGIVIFVDAEYTDINFGEATGKMWMLTILQRNKDDIHRVCSLFRQFDAIVKAKKLAQAEDIKKLGGIIEQIRRQSMTHKFAPGGEPVMAALSLVKHRYQALVQGQPKTETGVSEKLDGKHMLFFRFEDAILHKLTYDGVKVFEL